MEKKVMIVVEGALYGKMLAKEFQENGYGVCAILNCGEEAVAKARVERPDTILMDQFLQGTLDGIETAKIIKNEIITSIVLLENRLDESLFVRAGEIGVSRIINKEESLAGIVNAACYDGALLDDIGLS